MRKLGVSMNTYISGVSPYGAMDRLYKAADASQKKLISKAKNITDKLPVGLSAGDPIRFQEGTVQALAAMDANAAMTRMLIKMEQKKRDSLREIPA